jgi:uncharacterized cofD-like protein
MNPMIIRTRGLQPVRSVLELLFAPPGSGLRRWLGVAVVGGASVALAVAYLILGLSSINLPDLLPGWWEAIPLGVFGALIIAFASVRLVRKLGTAAAGARPDESLRDTVLRQQRQARGPRIVAIGGGTGLSTMLRGIKEFTSNITGVVTVTDDGGSSGKLREEMGVLPPGDIRNCIVALAEAEPTMKELFQYRFRDGSLAGHSFGNLFIAAMTDMTGSFERAVSESSRVLKVTGTIVPSTLVSMALIAELEDGTVVQGESNIPRSNSRITRLTLSAPEPLGHHSAIKAIEDAQLIVIGPGSLYTSVMPNLLVPGIAHALHKSSAPIVYVCNIATQPGETHGYTVADHVQAIKQHCPGLRLDYVLANSNMSPLGPKFPLSLLVPLGNFNLPDVRLVQLDLMNDEFRGHHDPAKLASALMDIYHRESGTNGRARR